MNGNAMMMQQNTPSSIMYADPAAVAAAEGAKARIQSAYIMAMQRPRNYDMARVRILAACRRPDFAEKVEYSKPIGAGKFLVGASVRFAELALREWGNIYYENQVIYDDERVRRTRVTVIDLETNTTYGKEIQMQKVVERRNATDREVLGERTNSEGKKVYTVVATEDEVATREAALISKALRNEGLRLIPQEIIEESVATARSIVSSRDKTDPEAAKKKLIDVFFSINVTPADLEKFLSHPIAQCTGDELQELRQIYTAIKEGEAHWSDFARRNEDAQAQTSAVPNDVSFLNGNPAAAKAQRKPDTGEKPTAPKEPSKPAPEKPQKQAKTDDENPPFFAIPDSVPADAPGTTDSLTELREENARRASALGWTKEIKVARLKEHKFSKSSILLLDMDESRKLSFVLDAEESEKAAPAPAQVGSLKDAAFGGEPSVPISDENGVA